MKRPLALILLVLVSACRPALDLSGKWAVQMDPDFKGQQTVENLVIRREGRGFVARFATRGDGGLEMPVRILGRQVTWEARTSPRVTAAWTGDLDSSANRITGTWLLTFADGSIQRGNFVGQRASR